MIKGQPLLAGSSEPLPAGIDHQHRGFKLAHLFGQGDGPRRTANDQQAGPRIALHLEPASDQIDGEAVSDNGRDNHRKAKPNQQIAIIIAQL